MAYVVRVAWGTAGSTVLVFDRLGRVVGRAYSEFTQHYPRPGWVEHDAEEIWRVTLRVLRQACRRAGARGRDIQALGITNQRETTVLWSRRTGRPVHRAIVWQDRRTAAYCDELRARGVEPRAREEARRLLDPYFSRAEPRCPLEHAPRAPAHARAGELRRRARHPAPRSSGCATASASSNARPTRSGSRRASTRRSVSTWSPPSWGSGRRTGTPGRAARSSVSRAA